MEVIFSHSWKKIKKACLHNKRSCTVAVIESPGKKCGHLKVHSSWFWTRHGRDSLHGKDRSKHGKWRYCSLGLEVGNGLNRFSGVFDPCYSFTHKGRWRADDWRCDRVADRQTANVSLSKHLGWTDVIHTIKTFFWFTQAIMNWNHMARVAFYVQCAVLHTNNGVLILEKK